MYLQRWSTHGCRYMQLSRAEVVEYCTESQRVTVKEVVPLPRPEIAPHLVIIREERVLEFFKNLTPTYCWHHPPTGGVEENSRKGWLLRYACCDSGNWLGADYSSGVWLIGVYVSPVTLFFQTKTLQALFWMGETIRWVGGGEDGSFWLKFAISHPSFWSEFLGGWRQWQQRRKSMLSAFFLPANSRTLTLYIKQTM